MVDVFFIHGWSYELSFNDITVQNVFHYATENLLWGFFSITYT